METRQGRIGGRFATFLDDQGIREDVEGQAVKELIAEQIAQAMKTQNITKVAMAKRMNTTRTQLDRLLDPSNPSVTLATLQRAARAVGRRISIELI
jgi:hypothetical protein